MFYSAEKKFKIASVSLECFEQQDSRFHRTTVHSNVSVTMTFYGKAVHLTPDTVDTRDEVKVFQQHCGGENLCVYRGKLAEGGEQAGCVT